MGDSPIDLVMTDFNGDGRLDLVVANYAALSVSVLLNTAAAGASIPTFGAQQTFATGEEPIAVAGRP